MRRPERQARAGRDAEGDEEADAAQHEEHGGRPVLAPSAMRRPISVRRRLTAYDITPYSPSAREQQREAAEESGQHGDHALLTVIGADVACEQVEVERQIADRHA